ncbi:MAG: hypothetical protein ACREJG_01880 [Candidatus Rokuibacteriota bacterium]
MPDIWTKHPDIVRDLLKEAGFTCGAEPRFLKPRDPAWTCIYDGRTMKGDLYIHTVESLRGATPGPFAGPATIAEAGAWTLPAVALVVAAGITRWRSKRRTGR